MAENLLSLTGVHKVYGQRVILDDVTFGLDVGDKVGLIGDNGAGKSTLLKMIVGLEGKDGGVIAIRGGARVGFLEQLPQLDLGKTAREVLAEPFAELSAAIDRYQHAAAELSAEADELLDRIERLGGWDWAHRVERAASQVGIIDLEQPVAMMSGGQQKRVAIARLMLEAPDLLLLDEPTNHLDAETITWLEGYLAESALTVLVVTHDRYFLERVVTKMAELRDGDIKVYAGRYQDYLEARAAEEDLRERTTQRRSQILKAELDWARRSPSARTTKSRSRLDRAYALEEEVRELKARGPTVDFQFAGETPRLGKTIIELEGVGKRYDGRPIVSDLSLMLRKGDRLGILGPNGCGKTTLLRMVAGEEEPDSGRIVRGGATRVAYFDQHRSALDPEQTVRRTVTPEGGDEVFFGGQSMHVASWLERFGFRTHHHPMRVASLSGGERNRLALGRFLLAEANVLLLDEPTNDLDIWTMHTLEEALLGFNGCVMVVTHDRYFLDRVATAILGFEPREGGGFGVDVVAGDYTRYHELKKAEKAARAASAKAEGPRGREATPAPVAAGKPARLSYQDKRELEGLEPRIEALEAELAELDAALADPGLWVDGAEAGLSAQARRDAAQQELDALFLRWGELSERAG